MDLVGSLYSLLRFLGCSVKPIKNFHSRRGVRQADPLSPLLFILVVELLQYIINKATCMGILLTPIMSHNQYEFPIIQYVDPTLIVMKASQWELFCMKGILHSFSELICLKVNYNKSCLLPSSLDAIKTAQLVVVIWLPNWPLPLYLSWFANGDL